MNFFRSTTLAVATFTLVSCESNDSPATMTIAANGIRAAGGGAPLGLILLDDPLL